MSSGHLSDREIVLKGRRIYDSRYRPGFERDFPGQFAAIDIITEDAFVNEFPEEALTKARTASPSGTFFLVRIGSEGAFKVSRISHDRPGLI